MSSFYTATLNRLIDLALALPKEQRIAWVDQLDGEFASLKPRLRALIAHSCQTGSDALLATLPKLRERDSLPDDHVETTTHRAGLQVGAYRLVRRLGAGAMGAVWLAQRTDGLAPHAVALKFAHVTPSRSDLQARLSREHQLLEALDHVNIARIYAADITAEGQPYLVLEYVAGEPLDAYCRAREPSLDQRLRLFLQLARAVAHAHQCQIVHRDLKPANVIVTADGTVRLLDFGIGKLLSESVPPELQLSRQTGQPLTPAYASPEQVLGAAAGLPSDVYSLGVVLYELLTDVRPFVPQRGSNLALRAAILAQAPRVPSEHGTFDGLSVPEQATLDAIVLRALQKQPGQRYPSAREFADAVEQLLTARLTAPSPR